MTMAALGSLFVASSLYAADAAKIVDINVKAADSKRISKEDLGKKRVVSEAALGLRKTSLYKESRKTVGVKADYNTL